MLQLRKCGIASLANVAFVLILRLAWLLATSARGIRGQEVEHEVCLAQTTENGMPCVTEAARQIVGDLNQGTKASQITLGNVTCVATL